GDQAVLDLGGGDPDSAALDQVVDSPAVPEVAVLVPVEEVAGLHGVPGKRLLRLLVLAPVEESGRVPFDRELAVLRNLGPVAGQELAVAARPAPTGPVRDVDVVGLARSDPVEHLDPERLEPAVVELPRKCLSR